MPWNSAFLGMVETHSPLSQMKSPISESRTLRDAVLHRQQAAWAVTAGSVPEHGLYDPFTGSATLPPALPIRAYFPHQLLPSCAWGAQHPEGRTLWVQSSTQNHGTHLPAASTSPKIHTWAFFLLSPRVYLCLIVMRQLRCACEITLIRQNIAAPFRGVR